MVAFAGNGVNSRTNQVDDARIAVVLLKFSIRRFFFAFRVLRPLTDSHFLVLSISEYYLVSHSYSNGTLTRAFRLPARATFFIPPTFPPFSSSFPPSSCSPLFYHHHRATTQLFVAFSDSDHLGHEPWETPIGVVVEGMERLESMAM